MLGVLFFISLFNIIKMEMCFSYLNDAKSYNEINCTPTAIYCCGNCTNRYCCSDLDQQVQQFECANNVDFCNSYLDKNDQFVQTFVCLYQTRYCCGDCKSKTCCDSYARKLNQSSCSIDITANKNTSPSGNTTSPNNLIYICVAVSVFIICMLVMALPILIIYLRYRKKSGQTFDSISREVSTVSSSVNENIRTQDNPPRYENLKPTDQTNSSHPPPYPGNTKV